MHCNHIKRRIIVEVGLHLRESMAKWERGGARWKVLLRGDEEVHRSFISIDEKEEARLIDPAKKHFWNI